MTRHPAVIVGLIVATATAAAVLGARMQRWRHREVEPCERHRWDTERTELVDLNIALRAENEEMREALPDAWQLGYEAGQHKAELELTFDGVERQQRQRARWN